MPNLLEVKFREIIITQQYIFYFATTSQKGQVQLVTIELLNPCCFTHLVTRDVQLQSLVILTTWSVHGLGTKKGKKNLRTS
jgi:hypothetical protein